MTSPSQDTVDGLRTIRQLIHSPPWCVASSRHSDHAAHPRIIPGERVQVMCHGFSRADPNPCLDKGKNISSSRLWYEHSLSQFIPPLNSVHHFDTLCKNLRVHLECTPSLPERGFFCFCLLVFTFCFVFSNTTELCFKNK